MVVSLENNKSHTSDKKSLNICRNKGEINIETKNEKTSSSFRIIPLSKPWSRHGIADSSSGMNPPLTAIRSIGLIGLRSYLRSFWDFILQSISFRPRPIHAYPTFYLIFYRFWNHDHSKTAAKRGQTYVNPKMHQTATLHTLNWPHTYKNSILLSTSKY